MGLRISFSIDDLDLPDELDDGGTFGISVPVDYSLAFEAFVDTFLNVATELVPVDTGYLRSSIDGDYSDTDCECYADAEYAQYVEYGTYKMSAQPYFEPAVQAAYKDFLREANVAIEEASNELEELLMEAAEDEAEEEAESGDLMGIGGSLGESLVQMAFTMIMMFVLFPLLVNIYGIIRTITDPLKSGASTGNYRGSGGGSLPEVEIY